MALASSPRNILTAQGPRDDALERVNLRLHLRQVAGVELLVDPGVVAGEELQPTPAKEVGTTVPDVGDRRLVAVDEKGDDRRPHSLERWIPVNLVSHPLVGGDDRGADALGRLLRTVLFRAPAPAAWTAALEGLPDGPNRETRRDLAVTMPPHAIGHRVDAVEVVDRVRVLVQTPALADVRACARPKPIPGAAQPNSPPFRCSFLRLALTSSSSPPQLRASL